MRESSQWVEPHPLLIIVPRRNPAPPPPPLLLNVPPTRTRVRIYVTFGMENEVKKWRFALSWINEQRSLMAVSTVLYSSS